jgi:hypothetical protein
MYMTNPTLLPDTQDQRDRLGEVAKQLQSEAEEALYAFMDEDGLVTPSRATMRVVCRVLQVLEQNGIGSPEDLRKVSQACQFPFAHLEKSFVVLA